MLKYKPQNVSEQILKCKPNGQNFIQKARIARDLLTKVNAIL